MERTPTWLALETTAALLLLTALCDAAGFQSASFLFLVLAVPAAAATCLAALGHVIDHDEGRGQASLAVALLVVVFLGAALRSPAIAEPGLPPAATVALVAAFVVVLVQALARLAGRSASS